MALWDWSGATSGGVSGAGIGSSFGPIGTAIGGGIGALTGGLFGGDKISSETETQKKQRELVDQLLGSLNGDGPYADLFAANEEDFNKSFRDPAMANFENRTAPMIKGQFTGGTYGQQRADGTGVEDSLARAGVDMEQMLNQAWGEYQNQAKNRQTGMIGQILGQTGAPVDQTFSQQFAEGGGIGKGFEAIGEGYRQRGLADERRADREIQQQKEGFVPVKGAS